MNIPDTQSALLIRYLLEQEGLSKDEVARLAGYSSRRMVDYVLADPSRGLGKRSIASLASALGLSVTALMQKALGSYNLNGPNFDDYAFVPKLEARPRGGEGGHESGGEIVDWYCFKREFLESKGDLDDMYLYEIAGGSMSPTLREGDMVMVNMSRTTPIEGKIYVVTLEDMLMVKRISVKPGFVVLSSDNPAVENIEVSREDLSRFRVDGQVVWACREF